jgi:hypothetical protein
MALLIIIHILRYAIPAPLRIKRMPINHPFNFRTYGKERIPEPIATAHKANMLPLTLLSKEIVCIKINNYYNTFMQFTKSS